ncbi:MAG: hypothetical protein J0L93_01145 [Deltaproteobacteria bacterium]|nr:hypothetical protein [Deltaproteobacteria bacterium]
MTHLKTYIFLTLGFGLFIQPQNLKAQGRMEMVNEIPKSAPLVGTHALAEEKLKEGNLILISNNFTENSELASYLKRTKKVQITKGLLKNNEMTIKIALDKNDASLQGLKDHSLFINKASDITDGKTFLAVAYEDGFLIQDKTTANWAYVSQRDIHAVQNDILNVPGAGEWSLHLLNQSLIYGAGALTTVTYATVETVENVSHNIGTFMRRCADPETTSIIPDPNFDNQNDTLKYTLNYKGTENVVDSYNAWIDRNGETMVRKFNLQNLKKFESKNFDRAISEFSQAKNKIEQKAIEQRAAEEAAQKKAVTEKKPVGNFSLQEGRYSSKYGQSF